MKLEEGGQAHLAERIAPYRAATRPSSGARSRRSWPAGTCWPWPPPTRWSWASTSASWTPPSASTSRVPSPACGRCGAAPGAAGGARRLRRRRGRARPVLLPASRRVPGAAGRGRDPGSPQRADPDAEPGRGRVRGAARPGSPTTTRSWAWVARGADCLVTTGQLRKVRQGLPDPRRRLRGRQHQPPLQGFPDSVAVIDITSGEMLGQVEAERAFTTVHPGAIYLHLGRSYEVAELDLGRAGRRCGLRWRLLHAEEGDRGLHRGDAHHPQRACVESACAVSVSEQVIAYQRKRSRTTRCSIVALDLPEQDFVTQALWYVVGDPDMGGAALRGAAGRAARLRAQPDRRVAADRDV